VGYPLYRLVYKLNKQLWKYEIPRTSDSNRSSLTSS